MPAEPNRTRCAVIPGERRIPCRAGLGRAGGDKNDTLQQQQQQQQQQHRVYTLQVLGTVRSTKATVFSFVRETPPVSLFALRSSLFSFPH